jgi:peptidoglycan/LPS O-acetylase OafA/YrhL
MRIKSLDGLRAFAILAVMLHHHEIVRGGWIGVDIFFVLSGFLITSILRRDRLDPRYWSRFYIRRATRILPPVLLFTALASVYYHLPRHSVFLYSLFLGNFTNSTSRSVVQLQMLWSLAVEEHFYLLFPLAVYRLNRSQLLKVLAAVVVLVPILRCLATPHLAWDSIYYWTFFRIDGLAMGAALAVLTEDPRQVARLTRWAAPIAVGFASVFGLLSLSMPAQFERMADTRLFNTLGYSLVAASSVFLIAYLLVLPNSLFARVAAWKPLVFIGAISYGLYLYHLSVMSFLIHLTKLDEKRVFPISASAAILISWLSFRFFEKPIIAFGHRISGKPSRKSTFLGQANSPSAKSSSCNQAEPAVH